MEMVHSMLGYDPQSAQLIRRGLGCIDYYRGDYENAIKHYREAMAEGSALAGTVLGIREDPIASG